MADPDEVEALEAEASSLSVEMESLQRLHSFQPSGVRADQDTHKTTEETVSPEQDNRLEQEDLMDRIPAISPIEPLQNDNPGGKKSIMQAEEHLWDMQGDPIIS